MYDPLAVAVRRAKVTPRHIPIKTLPEAEQSVPVPVIVKPKKDWMEACRQYEESRRIQIPPTGGDQYSLEVIKRAVADYFGVFVNEIESQRRQPRVTLPRQVFYYLAKRLTTKSFPQIGRAVGFRDHSTILSGCRKIERMIEGGHEIKQQIDEIERGIRDTGRGK